MKKLYLYLAVLLVPVNTAQAQSQFKDAVVIDQKIFALTSEGKIEVFNSRDGSRLEILSRKAEVTAIATDNNKTLIAVTNNTIERLDRGTWSFLYKPDKGVYSIFFDSNNDCFTLSESGIKDVRTGKHYFSAKSLNHQVKYKHKWPEASCSRIDRRDNIWLGFAYGEWGGNLFIFDTRTHKFVDPKLDTFRIELSPVRSFSEDSTSVYMSTGLQHMLTDGAIVRFDKFKARVLFESDSGWGKPDSTGARYMVHGHFIGPAGYNEFNSTLYFYSQFGFYKAPANSDLSRIDSWKLVVKPRLTWSDGSPDAIGPSMNVSKLIFLDKDRFLFVTQYNGLGFFDGKSLNMIQSKE